MVSVLGYVYVNYIHPNSTQTLKSVDLLEAYNLPPEQLAFWIENHSSEEVQLLVKQHIEEAIKNGATPVDGTIILNEEANTATIEEEQGGNSNEETNVVGRLFQFFLEEIMMK